MPYNAESSHDNSWDITTESEFVEYERLVDTGTDDFTPKFTYTVAQFQTAELFVKDKFTVFEQGRIEQLQLLENECTARQQLG